MEERAYESSVDLPELLARVEYDRELLREIMDIFHEDFPVLLAELKAALGRGDLHAVRVAAHTLKGMMASLSFNRASASARRVEQLASEFAPERIPAELERLERCAAMAQENLATACRAALFAEAGR